MEGRDPRVGEVQQEEHSGSPFGTLVMEGLLVVGLIKPLSTGRAQSQCLGLKISFWICSLVLLAGVAACGSSPTPTSTEQPATLAPERPTTGSTEEPPTKTAQQPITETALDHPAAAFAMLPSESQGLMYVDIDAAMRRPGFQKDVEFQLSHFVSQGEVPLAEEILRSIGTRSLTLASPYSGSSWAGVLNGDFARVQAALRLAAESGVGLSGSMIEIHKEVEIFALTRTRDSGYKSQVYLAVPNPDILAVSPNLDAVREMIDRQQEGLSLPQPLTMILQEWGLPDYLIGFWRKGSGEDAQSNPMGAAVFNGVHANLADGAATTLRFLMQFDNAEQAATANAWLRDQTDPRWRSVGLGEGVQIDQWQQKGATVYAEVTVPDEDVLELVTPN